MDSSGNLTVFDFGTALNLNKGSDDQVNITKYSSDQINSATLNEAGIETGIESHAMGPFFTVCLNESADDIYGAYPSRSELYAKRTDMYNLRLSDVLLEVGKGAASGGSLFSSNLFKRSTFRKDEKKIVNTYIV